MSHMIIDNSILAAAALIALLLTRYTQHKQIRSFPAFLLLFAPLVIFLNMWGHIIAISMVNYARYRAGSFQYNFYFYGLLLLGIVFVAVSGINIHCARKRIVGDGGVQTTMHVLNLVTFLLFIPLMPLNPIALLPVLASVISSVTLWAIRKKKVLQASEKAKGNSKVIGTAQPAC